MSDFGRLLSRPLVLLMLLGIVVAITGLATGSLPVLVVGVLVAVVAALGEGLTDLDLQLPGGQVKLKREPLRMAIEQQAQSRGLTEDKARQIAREVARQMLPP